MNKEAIDRIFSKLLDDPDLPEADKAEIRKGRKEAFERIEQGDEPRTILLDLLKDLSREIKKRSESN